MSTALGAFFWAPNDVAAANRVADVARKRRLVNNHPSSVVNSSFFIFLQPLLKWGAGTLFVTDETDRFHTTIARCPRLTFPRTIRLIDEVFGTDRARDDEDDSATVATRCCIVLLIH